MSDRRSNSRNRLDDRTAQRIARLAPLAFRAVESLADVDITAIDTEALEQATQSLCDSVRAALGWGVAAVEPESEGFEV